MSDTVIMSGNATGYGATSGSETFLLSGYDNTVLLAGADDTVTLSDGQADTIDLDSTGFTTAVTDSIDLGASTFNTITSSHDLFGASVSITGSSGPNSAAFTNHAGTTSVMLGYLGSASQQQGVIAPTSVTLNGDATNTVGVLGSGGAIVTIGQLGDGYSAYTSAVTLSGMLNVLTGGDEAFDVNMTGQLSTVTLGGGDNTLTLAGDQNNVTLGNGDNTLTFSGTHEISVLGTGSNVVSGSRGVSSFSFGSGGAGSTDALQFLGSSNHVTGGDETFVVTSGLGGLNSLTLGDGNDTVTLAGSSNKVTLGDGNDSLSFGGAANSANLGTGDNVVHAGSSGGSITFAAGGAGSTDTVYTLGNATHITAGNENVAIIGNGADVGKVILGDGNDTLNVTGGGGLATFGDSQTNTALNSATVGHGGTHLVFNGGIDQVTLNDAKGVSGYDIIKLNSSMIGTTLDAKGVFDSVTLTHDASAAITEEAVNGGMSLTIHADAHGGIGDVSVMGFAADELAHIHLVGTSAYTITTDNTPAGGLTLHFTTGTLDLVGLHSLPNSLFT